MVGEKEDDGILQDIITTKALQNPADFDVRVIDRVDVLRPVFAEDRVVRIVGRESNLAAIDELMIQARFRFLV